MNLFFYKFQLLFRYERRKREKIETRNEIFEKIEKEVLQKFTAARAQGLFVHDNDFRVWANRINKQLPNPLPRTKFNASTSWVKRIKKRNGIVVR